MKRLTSYRLGFCIMSLALFILIASVVIGLFAKNPVIAKAEKYISVPGDAVLVEVQNIYDKWFEKEVSSLHYKVQTPHDHRIIIKLDAATHELLFYSDTSKRCTLRAGTGVKINLDQAKKTAEDFIARVTDFPSDSRLTRAELLRFTGCDDRMYYEYWFEWSRVINGVEVLGEVIRVVVHASTGEVTSYCKLWFGEPPSNSEVKISKEQAVELSKKHLLEKVRASTSPLASKMVEAILNARVSDIRMAYARFHLAEVEAGAAPKGVWLCWIIEFTYTKVPEEISIFEGKWVRVYVQATTGKVIFVDSCK